MFFLISLLVVASYQIWYSGRIFPGISVQGIGVGGMTIRQAEAHLNKEMRLTPNGKIVLWHSDNRIEVEPAQIGIHLDTRSSAQSAFDFGRRGSIGAWFAYQLGGRFRTHNLPATIVFDQPGAHATLKQFGQQYDRLTQEASLALSGTQVISQMGQSGRHLDLPASLEQIAEQIRQLNLEKIVLPVVETAPQIMDASPYANAAQALLNNSFTIRVPDGQGEGSRSWWLEPKNLAPMLTFVQSESKGQTSLIPQLKEELLSAYLADLAAQLQVTIENPRFIFNDDTGQLDLLKSGSSGQRLDESATFASIQAALAQGQSSAEGSLIIEEPEFSDDAAGSDLGIIELVHSESSYFHGSSEARIQNIETAAAQFHGLLIPPYSPFSMAASMNEITVDNGYTEALIIFNGQTIEGIGGGVCQVSTTLFRSAFFTGFPISERHPHAYRVSYYEKTANNQRDTDLAGLDATVYVPIVDLKFENDTPYWLLMETYVNRSANRITWKFYSTRDGREVNWQTSGPTNIEKPEKALYKENAKLASGEIKQIEWEAEGAVVRVNRWVYRNGSLYFEDSFSTRYEPWRAVYEYGPGTEGIPKGNED